MGTPGRLYRANYAEYWEELRSKLKSKLDYLGKNDLRQYHLMKEFALQIGDILSTVADILQPRSFEELVKYGFDDPSADAEG